MFDDQAGGFVGREWLQRQHCRQQFAQLGQRQGWPDCDLKLLQQFWVPGISACPVPFGLGAAPQRQRVQRRIVAPGALLASQRFLPTALCLGVLAGALDEVALTAPPSQWGQRGSGGGIAQRAATRGVRLPAHEKPFFTDFTGGRRRPNSARGAVLGQQAALRVANLQGSPDKIRLTDQSAHFHRLGCIQYLRQRARAFFRAGWGFGDANERLDQLQLCVPRRVGPIDKMLSVQIRPKLPVSAIATVHADPCTVPRGDLGLADQL